VLQRRGIAAVIAALEAEEATLVLLEKDHPDEQLKRIRQLCTEQGIPVEEGSQSDVWRMSIPRCDDEDEHPVALALVGRNPSLDIDEVFENGGIIWLLDGVEYATNLGFCIRTAEVSGAAAVIISTTINHAERRTVRGSSMRANRFLPVIYRATEEVLELAKKHCVRIVVAEDVGTIPPWKADLSGDVLVVVGAEREGVSEAALAAADQIVRLPMAGFVPSYNLQVAISCLAIETLRQRNYEGN
jgi:tRNA G18 (ribose-2'-O)-methylase SpoU